MTLLCAILKKVQSTESIARKYPSPPPEVEKIVPRRKRKLVNKYGDVRAKVDSSVPAYDAPRMYRALLAARADLCALHAANVRLLRAIHRAHLTGKVDNRWHRLPSGNTKYYEQRANFLKHTEAINKQIYKRIVSTGPRVVPTASLLRDWSVNKQEMIRKARAQFVLFPALPTELVEDAAFLPPPGVQRPRVRLSLRVVGGATLGELLVELFPDVCPATCRLFLELLDGDDSGYGYVGTTFFRKVPGLFWSGGDVVHDNGFGCYVQRERRRPIGAQNYHFSHSMPGLLSMRVTADDEMCGIFNITFKPLPQFDLRNEVFGRVVRPSGTFDSMVWLGRALGARPAVQLAAARRRRRHAARWVHAAPNTRLLTDYRLRPLNKCCKE